MSRNIDTLHLVRRWALQIGVKPAAARLISRGLSPTTADLICRGGYKSTPGDLLVGVLLDELSKDGFTLNSTTKSAMA